jgi:preprotein translocase subunit Sec63
MINSLKIKFKSQINNSKQHKQYKHHTFTNIFSYKFSIYDKTSKNFYEILGINQNSTQDEIKQAYYKKAKIYHPDSKIKLNNKFSKQE